MKSKCCFYLLVLCNFTRYADIFYSLMRLVELMWIHLYWKTISIQWLRPLPLNWKTWNRVTSGWSANLLHCNWFRFDSILFSSLNKNTLIKHITSVTRAPVRSRSCCLERFCMSKLYLDWNSFGLSNGGEKASAHHAHIVSHQLVKGQPVNSVALTHYTRRLLLKNHWENHCPCYIKLYWNNHCSCETKL